eukprot:scaffold50914_cov48-Phaeocystis_antarctica.AAC.1
MAWARVGVGLGLGLGLGVAEQGQRSARVLPPRQLSPHVGELARRRALDPQHRPIEHGQLHRGAVQAQPLQPALPPVAVDLGVAVPRVTDDGVGESIEVLADLVPPSDGEGEGEAEGEDKGESQGGAHRPVDGVATTREERSSLSPHAPTQCSTVLASRGTPLSSLICRSSRCWSIQPASPRAKA